MALAALSAACAASKRALRGVHLALGDGALVAVVELAVAGEIRVGGVQLRVGAGDLRLDLLDLGLPLQDLRLGLIDGGPGAQHLRLGLGEHRLGAVQGDLVLQRVDPGENLPGLHRAVVVHQHFRHRARDARGDLVDVPADVGVVGFLEGERVLDELERPEQRPPRRARARQSRTRVRAVSWRAGAVGGRHAVGGGWRWRGFGGHEKRELVSGGGGFLRGLAFRAAEQEQQRQGQDESRGDVGERCPSRR